MNKQIERTLAGVALAITCACGDDGSSIDGSKVASDLTEDEAQEFCETRLYSNGTLSLREACTLVGIALASDAATCEGFVEQCLDEGDPRADLDCSDTKQKLAGCDATVSELDACFAAQNARNEMLVSTYTCADAPNVTQAETQRLPEGCDAARAKCPALAP